MSLSLHNRYRHGEWPQGAPWNEVIESLLQHRSVRSYLDKPLPEGTLHTLVAAAQSAATSSNLQAFSTQDSDEVLSEIYVTPLVDVMLVLLVVFIVTAPLLTNAIPINLPKTESVAPVEQKDPLVVSIDDKGKVFINKDEIQADLLEFNLQAAKAKNPDVRVQLQADNGVNYGEVARAMASIERAGITKLSVITAK